MLILTTEQHVHIVRFAKQRDQENVVHKFQKLERIVVIFGKQCHESNAKLTLQPLSTSPV